MFKVFKSSGIEGNYSISANPLFVNNNCWTVYPAKHRTTKKLYSVWQFSKKDVETRLTNDGVINRSNKKLVLDDIFNNIREFIGNQSKFKHPNFLTVIEPLEDHKSRILFVTEYVLNDLNTINKDELDEIMISKGLLQVSNGLKFLHESTNNVHSNLNPASILITENFDWKINNLTFLENMSNGIIEKYVDPIDSRLPSFLSLDFRFSSPNLIINHRVDYINDLFSICCVIYYLFNNGEMLIKCSKCSSISEYERQVNKLNGLLKSLNNNNKHAFFSKIPDNYYSIFIEILKNSQESNTDVIQLKKILTIDDFINSNIFNNELIKILNVIDELPTLSNTEKISFLRKLKLEIEKFPKPLLINKFIPILIGLIDLNQFKKVKEVEDPELQELIVESCDNLIILSQKLSQLTFIDKIYPFLLSLIKKFNFESFKILILKNLTIIKGCLNDELFEKFSLEIFNRCIDIENNKSSLIVQELTLMNLKVVIEAQNYNVLTSTILPKICHIYSTTTSLKIKILTLQCFSMMVYELDKKNLEDFLIIDQILPLIYKTSTANYSNSKFTTTLLKLHDYIFLKLSKSTNKTFNIKGEETGIYDILLNVGFNIWRIANYLNNRQDLDSSYHIWDKIQAYLKHDLNSKNLKDAPRETPVPENLQTFKAKPVKPMTADSVMSRSSISPAPSVSTATKPGLSFGQATNASSDWNTMKPVSRAASPIPPKTTRVPATNSEIDWSRTEKHAVMRPTTRSTSASSPAPVPAPANANSQWNSYGVMTPQSKSTAVEVDDDDEDEGWGDFEVGSTTAKPVANSTPWGESLI